MTKQRKMTGLESTENQEKIPTKVDFYEADQITANQILPTT
jgi:hypothetical protein